MSEIFDEVNEDVRREQLKRFWDKYSLLIVLLAIVIVGGVGGWRGYQYLESKKTVETSAAFDRAIDLSEQKKHAEAEAAFNKIAVDAPSGYRTLARLRAAGEVAERDKAAAVPLYDAIAADRSVNLAEQDLAKVRAAGLVVDSAGYDDMKKRLEAVTAPAGTYRHTARELLALSAWRNGNADAARQWLDQIANDGETPSGMRSRAEALQALLPPVAKS